MWFLNQPVDGQWHRNSLDAAKPASRRSGSAVTAWRYLLLESDEAPEDLWLKLLALCGLPIVAIYSSGKRSWHALLKAPEPGIDAMRHSANCYKKILPEVGADPAALTPVRLTRLPGCTRGGMMQRLIYLNPHVNMAERIPILRMAERRGGSG